MRILAGPHVLYMVRRSYYKYGFVSGVKLIGRRFKAGSSALKSIQYENPKKKGEEECFFLHGVEELACC